MSATFIQTIEEGLEQTRQQASFNNQPDDLLIEDGAGTSLTRNSAACRNTGIHHVGLYAKDPAASAEFYRDIFGMKIVGGSEPGQPSGATAFLSSRPDEESHEIALFENRAFVHAAFKVASLAELRSLHARVVERNIEAKLVLDHGVSFAFYFADPDDNIIEVYWPTGVQGPRPQPYGAPLDLMQPDEILLRKIAPMSAEDGAGAKSSNETAPVPGRNQVECVPAGTDRTYKSPSIRSDFFSPVSKQVAPFSWPR